MWFVPPNQSIKGAYTSVLEPAYNKEETGSLLTLPAPALPLVWVVKVAAALVLLPLSAARVVVGLTTVCDVVVCAEEAAAIRSARIRGTNARTFPPDRPRTASCRVGG